MNRLNQNIKFDLHIHSKASEYKESAGIVNQSTKENLGVLLSKLNEHNVALFSITDHNRFDPELYLEVIRMLGETNHPYPNVKAVLAGVEFDVKLDETMGKCHIIAIFDTKGEPEKLARIKTALDAKQLTKRDQTYTRKELEEILEDIGLSTILIAAQRKSIHNASGNHNSLSDSTADVEQIIKIGYVNALEFQKPKVEAILINNLKELSLPIPLFSGSDCHDWAQYPYHSQHNQNREFHHSEAKILPTFKGLLMAISSPETRFNRSENDNASFIGGFELQGQKVPFVSGINAIIGENGSGKTTILQLISGASKKSYVGKLIRDNDMKREGDVSPQAIKYIEQGQIIEKFNAGNLFSSNEDNNYKEIDHTNFKEAYSTFSGELKKAIEARIKRKEKVSSLTGTSITFEDGMIAQNYYVDIEENKKFQNVENPHESALNDLNVALAKTELLLQNAYFSAYKTQLNTAISELKIIKNDIQKKWAVVDYEVKVKNIMHGSIKDYLGKVKENLSAKDRQIKEYEKKQKQFVDLVVEAVQVSISDSSWPQVPPAFKGASQNPKHGFYFNKEAHYNGIAMGEAFFAKMFVKNYNNIEALQTIETYEKYVEAVRDCTSPSEIEEKWEKNFEKFINEAIETSEYIMEGTDQRVGNTLGEMSLSYYKFFTQDDQEWSILIVDQPEDNISNNNISQKLIRYFSMIRGEKQIIFVTHNPLLVVNLDADNVVYLKNDGGAISAYNGCLEYEDEGTNILELVAQNMDGGKETIEKRLKIYGKGD